MVNKWQRVKKQTYNSAVSRALRKKRESELQAQSQKPKNQGWLKTLAAEKQLELEKILESAEQLPLELDPLKDQSS